MSEHLVIVGGGQAAAQAVQSLRQQSFAGAITLLGDEPYPPYQRPPLSKKYFAGELARERLLLRPAAFYAEKGRRARAERARRGDRARGRRVRLRDGRTLAYDRLLLATGSRVRDARRAGRDAARRALPAHDRRRRRHHGVARARGARLLVGAGYIGLEVAAVDAPARLRRHGARGDGSRHVAHGQRRGLGVLRSDAIARPASSIHCGAAVKALHGAARVSAVETADGRRFALRRRDRRHRHRAQRRARGAPRGCECTNGIVVDEFARTADPHIVAAGDCTNHPLPLLGRRVRLESVPNAIHQAKVAAATSARRAVAVFRGAVVLVRSVRLEAADRGAVDGLRRGRAARRPRRAQLRRVLSACRPAARRRRRSTARRSSSRGKSSSRIARASRRTCCATRAVDSDAARRLRRYCAATCGPGQVQVQLALRERRIARGSSAVIS